MKLWRKEEKYIYFDNGLNSLLDDNKSPNIISLINQNNKNKNISIDDIKKEDKKISFKINLPIKEN